MQKKTIITLVVILILAALFFAALYSNPPLMPGEDDGHSLSYQGPLYILFKHLS